MTTLQLLIGFLILLLVISWRGLVFTLLVLFTLISLMSRAVFGIGLPELLQRTYMA